MSLRFRGWCVCVFPSIRSGEANFSLKGPRIQAQGKCLLDLLVHVRRFCSLDSPIEKLDWSDFFKVRSIDYKGDEVKVARKFQWKNISPALPVEIGRVPLEEVCSQGSKHYVLNFEKYLKPSDQWVLGKAPRVMVDDDCWPEVCRGWLLLAFVA